MSNIHRYSELYKTLAPPQLTPGHEYVIELRQFPIAGVGEHHYWVLRNRTLQKDIAEIHGGAFDKHTELPKAKGSSGDLLGFFQGRDQQFKKQAGEHVTTTLEISGPTEEIERRWNAGLASAGHFNEKRIGYDLLGGSPESGDANSNGAARSIGAAMGLSPEVLENAPQGTWRAAPGWKGRDLHEEYPDVPRPPSWGSATGEAEDSVRVRKITPRIEPVKPPTDLGMAPGDGGDGDGTAAEPMRMSAGSRDHGTVAGSFGDDILPGGSGNDSLFDGIKDGDLDAEAERLIAAKDYYDDPRKQARVRALFQEITRREARGRESPDGSIFQNMPYFPDAEGERIGPSAPRDFLDRGEPSVPVLFGADQRPRHGLPPTDEPAESLLAEADALIGSDDYWNDPHKQRRVAAIFKRLYPGQVRTAPLDFGEGV